MTSTKRPTPKYPTSTKILVPVILALAVGMFALAGMRGETSNSGGDVTISGGNLAEAGTTQGVEAIVPPPGSQLLAQEEFGIDLLPGWTGTLEFDPASGPPVPIPLSEMNIVTELDQYFFRPGPGQIYPRLPQGPACVRATIFDQTQGREASERVEEWCFTIF